MEVTSTGVKQDLKSVIFVCIFVAVLLLVAIWWLRR
jgi:preprotein translocase subunit Sec61beta